MRTSNRNVAVATLALVVLGFPWAAFSQTLPRQSAKANSMSEMPEILAAPLFIEANGFTSRITMVSELNFAVTADVILVDRSGLQIASRTVAFSPHSRQAVQVADLLRESNSAATFGSIEIRPDPAKVVSMAEA